VLIGSRAAGAVNSASILGDVMVLVGIMMASAGYVAGGKLAAKIGAPAATAWGIGLAGLLLAPPLLARLHFGGDSVAGTTTSWFAVLYLAGGTSILGYAAWYWAIDKAGVAQISPMQFLQPVVSLILAISLLGEKMTMSIGIALAAIIGGVVLTRRATVTSR
jgi:drug/metabolite transporter (DMT)-like permease